MEQLGVRVGCQRCHFARESKCRGHCRGEHLQLEQRAVPGVARHTCGCTQGGGMPRDLRKGCPRLPDNRSTGHSASICGALPLWLWSCLSLPSELVRAWPFNTPGADEGGGLVNYLELPKVSS